MKGPRRSRPIHSKGRVSIKFHLIRSNFDPDPALSSLVTVLDCSGDIRGHLDLVERVRQTLKQSGWSGVSLNER